MTQAPLIAGACYLPKSGMRA